MEGPLIVSSPRLWRISEESLKLKGIMLEVQRLRRLVDLAEAEVRSRPEKARPGRRRATGLVVKARPERIANSL
jgi:hypothetical protein